MEKQLLRVKRNLDACPTPLSKYIYLAALHDRNETLYYKLLMKHMNELASIVYTPTVGEASQVSHAIYRRPRGMYFSTQDRGQMSAMVYNWPQDEVDVIVVTDGSRILGLGDLGANGMQIPIGKLSLYVAAGGIRPRAVLPVVLDVGTNNKELLNDPLYLGMPHPRLTGNEYYEFVDEWVTAVKSRWPDVLIQFEDFQNPHAYNLLNRYRDSITCTNDDIQSTSAVTLAGILASLKARGKTPDDLADERIVCVGAGTSGVGVCEGIVDCMVDQGHVKSREEAYSKIHMLDSSGLLGNPSISSDNRTAQKRDQSVSEQQRPYVKRDLPDQLSLEEVVRQVKPTVLLGFTGARGVFTEKAIREMANHYEKPVIFPLSNPDSHSECTAEEAFKWTDGRAIFASGTQFDEVRLPNGKVGKTNQCNNSYTFPGVGLGVVVSKATKVTDRMFLEAGRTLAEMASESQLKQGQLFPHVDHLREVSFRIGTRVCEVAFEDGVANAALKEGELLSELVKNTAYEPQYVPLVYHPKL
ncbi:malic-domain-containing protein [Rhizopus microsporus var. microsporus]|nr:malic-domain-containing protein [Rhizopus microsporus var. microsporus]